MASSTGAQIRGELIKYGLVRLLGQGTATAGGTNRIRDATRLDNAGLASTAFDGCFVRINAGTAAGEQVMVDYLDQDAGDLYVDPVFSGAPTTSSVYEIWRSGINPDMVDRLRDEALTRYCSQWQDMPMSIVTNAAYMDGVTGWTAVTSTRAQTKNTFPEGFWPYTLLVTNSAGSGRVTSASIYGVRADDYFFLYVPVSVRSGTANIIVRDITNGANISLSSGNVTETRRGWSAFKVTGQVPSTCDEIQVWLQGTEASAIVEWGPVFMHPRQARRLVLDPRVNTADNVGPVYIITNFPEATGGGSWSTDTRTEVPDVRKITSNDLVYVQWETPIYDLPYYYEERMFYTALSATYLTAAARVVGDAATTLCPLEYAAAGTAKVIARHMLAYTPHEHDYYAQVLTDAEDKLAKFERRFGPKQQALRVRERLIRVFPGRV